VILPPLVFPVAMLSINDTRYQGLLCEVYKFINSYAERFRVLLVVASEFLQKPDRLRFVYTVLF